MSAETQPDPILPNYNPSSWDVPTLSPEERAILDTEYITFPIAQNQNITFPVSPVAPTLPNGTNTEQVATTGFVQNAITALKAASNVWGGIQTFSAGITTATISAISGTFTLTGTNIANNTTFSGTTTLSNPFTIGYSYPVAADKIGQILTASSGSTNTANGATNILSLSIPKGIWILNGKCQFPLTVGMAQLGFGTLAIPVMDETTIGQDVVYTNTQISGCPNSTAFITNHATTTWYLVCKFTTAGNINVGFPVFTAARLA
jgi:hypothetical protein